MHGKLTLSFSVATFIAALGALLFLGELRTRLSAVEVELKGGAASAGAAAPVKDRPVADATQDPLATKDALEKLDWMVKKLEEVHTQVYEGVIDLESEMYQLRQEMTRMKVRVTRILEGLRSSGNFAGFESGLPDVKAPLTIEQRKEFKAAAERWGMQVREGIVVTRGLLNGEQDRAYPIEYLMTRFPEAGHETLLHLLGNVRIEDFAEPPYPDMGGVVTALYKALLGAGFEQGEFGHPEREPTEPFESVPWVLATGDAVHMYVRWKNADGSFGFARATDWMLDPATKAELPADCFKFTGSMRVEHRETGDEMLLAEGHGFVVSAYPDRRAIIEVAVPSVTTSHLAYNWTRLPQHTPGQPFLVDLVFSKAPLTEDELAALSSTTTAASAGSGDEDGDGK